MIRLRPIRAALLLLALPSCADLAVEPGRVPTTLALDASEVTLTQGDPVALRVTVLDQNGDPIATPGWAEPTWASSNSHVVRVRDGGASAHGPGQAVATATLAGLTASAVVRVNPSAITLRVDSVAYRQNGADVGILTPGLPTTVRVFLAADKVNFFTPSVRLDVVEGGGVVESLVAAAPGVSVPQGASGDHVWEVTVPGSLVRPGASFRVVPDPEGALPHTAASQRVHPASGSIAWRFAVTYAIHSVQLVQSIQRPDGSVPLVAGRDALLRVFATSDVDVASKPTIRASFYRAGALVRSYDMQRSLSSFPRTVSESFLGSSWNVRVPGDVLTPGTTLVVEADPTGEIPRSESSAPRFPASGALSLDVREVPTLAIRLIPVHQTATGTTGDVGAHNLQDFLDRTWSKFPLLGVDADLRSPYTTNARLDTEQGWLQLLSEIRSLRDVDGSTRYYYGVHKNPPGAVWGGLGYVGGRAAIGYDASQRAWETMAHELGHNFGLVHAPCGGPGGVDPLFPYIDGSIGAFGYDLLTGTLKAPGSNKDLMTYCGPEWISDYHYRKVMDYRQARDWSVTGSEAPGVPEPALLVWGRMHRGEMVLEPAFELEMRPSLPRGGGPYRVEGVDADGAILFSYSFTPSAVDHADAKSFSFAIPSRIAQPERLAALRLTGPEGRTTRGRSGQAERPRPAAASRAGRDVSLSWDGADLPMALVRDADTGEVLSFARGGAARVRTSGRALDVIFSDGVRSSRRSIVVR